MKPLILFLAILCTPIFAVCQTSIKCSIVGYGGGEIRSASTIAICCLGEPIIGDVGTTLRAGFIGVLENINGLAAPGLDSLMTPRQFSLSVPFPNPFNTVTRIAFSLPATSNVLIRIFDVSGREVATLIAGELQAGNHTAVWSAEGFTSGIYLVKMETSRFNSTRKLTLVK